MKQKGSIMLNENELNFGSTDSIFDWNGLLHRLMGDEDLAKEIIEDFLKQIPENLFAVKNALNKKDLQLIKREGHTIKGASGNVGALTLQEIGGQIETAGEEKDLDKARSLVQELDTQLEILKNILAQLNG
jgi:HPt (histidine-containing phosphotransfer) domain-containing protein